MAAPKLYPTTNVLHNPAEPATSEFKPVPPPTSPAAALSSQKKMLESGIQTTKAAYAAGAKEACVRLGLTKAARASALREALLSRLTGPKGSTWIKVPMQAVLGGLAGGAVGKVHNDNFWPGAAIGATSVGLRGFAVDHVPNIHKALIRRLGG